MDTNLDLTNLDAPALHALKGDIDKQLATRERDQTIAGVNQIKGLMSTLGISMEQLHGHLVSRKTRKAGAATKNPPKFLNPDTGDTWTGRGRKPKWIKAAKNPEAYLISAQGNVHPLPLAKAA